MLRSARPRASFDYCNNIEFRNLRFVRCPREQRKIRRAKTGAIQDAPSLLILGGGALATECYIPALIRLGWENRVMVIDASEEAAAKIHKLFPTVRTLIGHYPALLEDRNFVSQFNGSVVALPNYLHEEAVILSMDAGLDVLCEKPLAMDVDSCLRLAAAAEQRGRRLAVAMVRRLIPSVMAIREAIQGGLVGDVRELKLSTAVFSIGQHSPAVTFKKQMAVCFSTWEFTTSI